MTLDNLSREKGLKAVDGSIVFLLKCGWLYGYKWWELLRPLSINSNIQSKSQGRKWKEGPSSDHVLGREQIQFQHKGKKMEVVTNNCCLAVKSSVEILHWTPSAWEGPLLGPRSSLPLSSFWHCWKLSKIKASVPATRLMDSHDLLLRPFLVLNTTFLPPALFWRRKRRDGKQLAVQISLQCIWCNISQALQSCYFASHYISLSSYSVVWQKRNCERMLSRADAMEMWLRGCIPTTD